MVQEPQGDRSRPMSLGSPFSALQSDSSWRLGGTFDHVKGDVAMAGRFPGPAVVGPGNTAPNLLANAKSSTSGHSEKGHRHTSSEVGDSGLQGRTHLRTIWMIIQFSGYLSAFVHIPSFGCRFAPPAARNWPHSRPWRLRGPPNLRICPPPQLPVFDMTLSFDKIHLSPVGSA